jgi:hypothetical protein
LSREPGGPTAARGAKLIFGKPPPDCDVIVDRYEILTGTKAKRSSNKATKSGKNAAML